MGLFVGVGTGSTALAPIILFRSALNGFSGCEVSTEDSGFEEAEAEEEGEEEEEDADADADADEGAESVVDVLSSLSMDSYTCSSSFFTGIAERVAATALGAAPGTGTGFLAATGGAATGGFLAVGGGPPAVVAAGEGDSLPPATDPGTGTAVLRNAGKTGASSLVPPGVEEVAGIEPEPPEPGSGTAFLTATGGSLNPPAGGLNPVCGCC